MRLVLGTFGNIYPSVAAWLGQVMTATRGRLGAGYVSYLRSWQAVPCS